jgi:hypothetical protein
MLKKPASSVLASLKASTYMKKYASGLSLAAALLDDLFGQAASVACPRFYPLPPDPSECVLSRSVVLTA